MRATKAQLATVAAIAIVLICFLSWGYGNYNPDWESNLSVKGQQDVRRPTAGAHPYIQPNPTPWNPPTPKFSNSSTAPQSSPLGRVVVWAALEGQQDTSRLREQFPGWELSFQPLRRDFAKLHFGSYRTDKGRIANAYLTYIIENYNNLPKMMVFLNDGPYSTGHSDTFNNADAVQTIQTEYIEKIGYANLRCMAKSSCTNHYLPTRDPPQEFRTLEVAIAKVWNELFLNDNVPEKLASPCCAEFAVSSAQVRKRDVADYLRFWEWLHKTSMDDDTSGLVFEYIWHIIFGQEAEYCLELEKCECDLYGRC